MNSLLGYIAGLVIGVLGLAYLVAAMLYADRF